MANEELVIKLLQALLHAELGKRDITPTVIAEKLDWLLKASPQFGIEPDGFDRQAIIDEMIRRFSLWIGKDTLLTSDTAMRRGWCLRARGIGGTGLATGNGWMAICL